MFFSNAGIRPRGFEPLTYGLEITTLENIKSLELTIYQSTINSFSTNFSGNFTKIQQNLTKIINRWSSLPPKIQTAIMVLVGGGEDE